MSLTWWEPLLHWPRTESRVLFSGGHSKTKLILRQPRAPSVLPLLRAGISETPSVVSDADVVFSQTFPLKRTKTVEGKVSVKVGRADKEGSRTQVVICCNLQGKWIMHWGVTYCDDESSEWDQPPSEMRPPGSITIKGYAVETPMKRYLVEGQVLHEVQIEFDSCKSIAAINFVLREEEKGAWIQHKGRDFRIQLRNHVQQGLFDQVSNFLLKPDNSHSKDQECNPVLLDHSLNHRHISDFYEEYSVIKEEFVLNSVTITVRKSFEADKHLVYFDADLPDVIIHWGVCRNDIKNWELPPAPFPPSSNIFRQNALQTLLQQPQASSASSSSRHLLAAGLFCWL